MIERKTLKKNLFGDMVRYSRTEDMRLEYSLDRRLLRLLSTCNANSRASYYNNLTSHICFSPLTVRLFQYSHTFTVCVVSFLRIVTVSQLFNKHLLDVKELQPYRLQFQVCAAQNKLYTVEARLSTCVCKAIFSLFDDI